MTTDLQSRLGRIGRWLPAALLLTGLPLGLQAQTLPLPYHPSKAVNTTTAYTDLGTTGTVITTANTDDANSAATPIGFTFNFNNASFTDFVLNTNGIMRLGTAAPSVTTLFAQFENGQNQNGVDPIGSTSAANVNLIAPFNFDLQAGTAAGGAEYRVATTGTAPNRVCTVQWKNVKDKAGNPTPSQYDSFNFQVKLYETTNVIEFVYGPTVAGVTGADALRFPTIGIKGSGSNPGQTVLANKTTSAGAWSTTAFITGQYVGTTHNIRRTAPADAGRTYRFVPSAIDVAVSTVYTLGQVPRTLVATSNVVQAVVTNTGTTAAANVPVTLTVSGANTFTNTQTVASIPAGGNVVVSFTGYPLTNAGANTLTVTSALTNDEVLANNAFIYSQNVTTNRLSYFNTGQDIFGTVGVGEANGALAARFTLAQGATITSISPTFANAGTANTTYQVQILDASGAGGTPGTVLFTSATQTRPTLAAGATSTVNIAVPNLAVPAGNFYVAIRELNNNVGLAYQFEDPLRPNTFYFTTATSGWTPVNNTTLRTRLALEVGFNVLTSTRGTIGEGTLSVYPNPASRNFTLELPAISGERSARVTLINNLGQQVQARILDLNAGGTQAQVDVSGLAAGVYTLRVQTSNQSAAQQVVIQ